MRRKYGYTQRRRKMLHSAKYIEQERDDELREALKDLDEYLCM